MKTYTNWGMMTCVALLVTLYPGQVDAAKRARYQEVKLEQSGSIVGTVRFDGKVSKPQPLKVTTPDEVCHRGPILDETLVVSEKKTIKWVVARITKIARGKPFPKGLIGEAEKPRVTAKADKPGTLEAKAPPAATEKTSKPLKKQVPTMPVIDQNGCRFIPHVAVVPERRPVRILNSDGILHNVHTYAKFNAPLNKAMQATVKKMDVTFKRRERILMRCDIHKWMRGWIIVAEHPYYAVTGEEGTFRLKNVPPGTYTVEVWHETLGKLKQKITVKADKESRLEFVFKDKKKKK